ncbi:fatty acid desaturase family protein [Acidihalobacter prosperus]|uniref:Fatty acid desaturase n=1 Tax=Acidihalobacter prosperus TaxID=160660 RepID=A0A1A6C3Y0_9GAMM|nr:fatty acid desaturase [Acidihalobacter prosperus]OBS09250.1 fatty acid desaturase [Acidihalobacter prosperus]
MQTWTTRLAALAPREPGGTLATWAFLAYATLGYALGVWLLTRPAPWLAALGVLLTAHTLVIAAYFIHEFAHLTIFRSRTTNDRFGTLMTWITGACYAPFDNLRRKHLRHHADRADVVTFDYLAFLKRLPVPLRKLVVALEWLHVPAVELIMHGFVIVMPFISHEQQARRGRVLAILAIRVVLFGALGLYAPRALWLYALAYLLFLAVLRFVDAFQHTYVAYPLLASGKPPDMPARDREYEYRNTYSNLVSVAHPWLNLLTLNFVYHNAHHARASVPWFRLPALHRELYGASDPQVLPMRELLRTYHRNRLARVLGGDYGAVGEGRGRADGFVGAVGVSFLTAV